MCWTLLTIENHFVILTVKHITIVIHIEVNLGVPGRTLKGLSRVFAVPGAERQDLACWKQ